MAGDLWSPHDETRLLIWSMAGKSLAQYARNTGRSYGAVRLKLMRMRRDELLKPPTISRAAVSPQDPLARGPSDTSDTAPPRGSRP